MTGPPLTSAVFQMRRLKGIDLFEVTIDQLQEHYYHERLTCAEYVGFCLERLRQVDPYLEAVIETNPDAEAIAYRLDEERKQGKVRGSLHGIPILVKDNLATKDRMQTTAGSWALLGSVVPRDSKVVSALREAGVVILGKSNMSEWASLRSSSYSTGYSPRRGQTRNPYDLTCTPFGSSSGSAVSVSANIVPLSIGTETDTSIIGPAKTNGVVGIKPTVGTTSLHGVIPISRHLDTVGTIARTVADAAHGLSAISESERDFVKHITSFDSLKGARFGLPRRRFFELLPDDVREIADRVLEDIRAAGSELVMTDFPCADSRIPPDGSWDWTYGAPEQSEYTVVKADAYNGIKSYLSECENTSIKSLEDVVAYNEANRGTEGAFAGDHPAFPSGQDGLHECIQSGGREDEIYKRALTFIRQQCREEGFDAAIRHESPSGEVFELDALLIFDVKGAGMQLAAQAGYPIITVPIGLDPNDMPLGLSFHHVAHREADLVKWASAVEDLLHKKYGGRALPTFRNHTAKNIPINKL